MREYYDTRAPEYDDWYLDRGLFAARARSGWADAVTALEHAITALAPARTLDVACGTGFLTQHLRGALTGLDQSRRMLAIAGRRVPRAQLVCADALAPPLPDGAFERVFTGHFYGHLEPAERAPFLTHARRLAPELVVVDSALRPDHGAEEWQERILSDGSAFPVYKRYFDGASLARELGGGEVVHESEWFVMVSSPRPDPFARPRPG